jgi:hypothetical protein
MILINIQGWFSYMKMKAYYVFMDEQLETKR